MKKLFLIPLLALMCSVTAWANKITLGGTGANYSSLANLKTAIDNGSLPLSASDSIILGANQNFAKNGVYDFKNATIICGAYRFTHSTGGGEITIKNVMLKDATNSGGAVNIQTSSATTVNFVNVKSYHNGITIGVTKTQPSTAPTINIDEDCVIAGNIWSNGTYSIQLYGSANINNKGQLTKYVAVHRHAESQYLDAVVNINNEGTIDQGVLADANQTVNIVNSGTLTQAVGNNGIFNLTNNGVATIYGDPTILPSGKNAQYNGTISFDGSVNADIIKNGEPNTVFNVVPSGSKATIHRYCYFPAGIGDLAIEDGYYWRSSDGKIMEADGLVASVFHTSTSITETFEELSAAFAAALTGDKITLEKDLNTSDPIWIGTISVDGTPRDLILDLNGHTIRSASHVIETLILSHGSLNIINSVPGEGGIYNEATKGGVAVQVHGSYLQNCNPRTQTPFTHLTISEGVDISATGVDGSGVAVYELDINERAYSQFGVDYLTNIYREWAKKSGVYKHTEQGVANGVRVDINGHITAKKYGFKVNGNIDFPDVTKYGTGTKAEASRDSVAYWNGYVVSVGDTAYCPYIHIGSTALLEGDNSEATSAALYASGYARYDIEGTLKGASGLYVRGGKVTVKNDANIQSTFEGSASFTPGSSTSGIDTKGNAIVLNPKSGYPGHIEFIVEGDAKMSTKATGGAALLEDVATPDMLESIAINGGQFTGPYALAICEATQASGAVVVFGTTLTSENVADVSGIMAENTHKVVIPNNDGTTTVVVSQGETPTSVTNFGDTNDPQEGDIVSLLPGSDVKWTGTTAGVIGDGVNPVTLALGELQIVTGTAENHQLLTIREKATLKVDRLIMNENARIIVQNGGQLIVSGTQGINAPSTDNIEFVSSETENSVFLLNPAVTSNRHPSATYKFKSKARKLGDKNFIWQRFGAPTYNGAVTMTWEADVKTAVFEFNYATNSWEQFPVAGETKQYVLDGKPFQCYNMTINENPAEDVEYTFAGDLMGNANAPLEFVLGWNSYANSYTAPIDIKSFLNEIKDNFSGVSASIYVYKRNGDGTTNWVDVNLSSFIFGTPEVAKINPMQAFILQLRTGEAGEKGAINYAENVYNPFMGIEPNHAPARVREESNLNGAYITVTDGVQTEELKVLESADFSDAFDNGWDAEKFDNENNFSLYCQEGETKLSSLATNDLTDKTIAFDNKNAGEFTLNVVSAVGTTVKIYDAVAQKLIELTEGAEYQFTADAINDAARFIINPSDVPSAIDNTEIVGKASKFMKDGQLYIRRGDNVYTVQGQNVK